jgi:GrpB-like predicted nucleotidyltransferase (UPF0157 family)
MSTDEIGLERGVVRLAPYNPAWQQVFAVERARLLEAVAAYVLDIQHVGSTAVPGLSAKPIVDIAVAVVDFDAARVCIGPLLRLGYAYKGENGTPRRHYFGLGEPRRVHLHMLEIGSRVWQDLIRFRDYLLAHPPAVAAYAALKADLARRFSGDRQAYTSGKTALVEALLHQAALEAANEIRAE